MKKVEIMLDSKRHKTKPKDIGSISKSIVKNRCMVTIEEFAKSVGEQGKTFMPCIVNGGRKKENYMRNQVYALDFDNDITPDEFLCIAEEYNLFPAFIYETFSSSEQQVKFRAVFVGDVINEYAEGAELVINMLFQIFPKADRQCKDLSRLFFGGKKLIYTNYEAEISIRDLAVAIQTMCQKRNKNCVKKVIDPIAKDLNIAISKNIFLIEEIDGNNFEDDFSAKSSIYMGSAQFSSKVYKIKKYDAKDKVSSISSIEKRKYQDTSEQQSGKNIYPELRNITKEHIKKTCPLYRDFCSEEIHHKYKFHIATSLQYVRNGKTFFFENLVEHIDLWKSQWSYLIKNFYVPSLCNKEKCPYYESCRAKSLYDKLSKKIIREDEGGYIERNQAEELLKKNLERIIYNEKSGIHLVKAQTGLGKTKVYCDLIKECKDSSKAFLIVVPSIKLQEEVCDNLKKRKLNTYKTCGVGEVRNILNDADLDKVISALYDTGYHFKVKGEIKNYAEKNESELTDIQKQALNRYFNNIKNIKENNIVVTTHAMFLHLPQEILQRFEIIIDEDILMTVFRNTQSISFRELRIMKKKLDLSQEVTRLLEKLLNSTEPMVCPGTASKITNEQKYAIYNCKINAKGSIPDFLNADAFYVDGKESKVYFFCAAQFPKCKMTILSATIKNKIYQDYFRAGDALKYVEIPLARLKGKLLQFTAHSMSRSYISKLGFQKIDKRIKKFLRDRFIKRITFLKFDDKSEIHIGHTEGFNDYSGKNIVYIGTPHIKDVTYKLIGCYLGYDTSGGLHVKRVAHSGYRFKMMTYSEEQMRELQFYFIESEMEQGIGRARLLRNACVVYLFSNFPMRQAEIIEEDYMLDNATITSNNLSAA